VEEERLNLLRTLLSAQQREIEGIYAKIAQRRGGKTPAHFESLAYQLHNLSCAFEDLFQQVAEFFENTLEDPARYHRELLWRMKIPIEGVRPALLSEEAYKLLDSLRAFRHFFRHAYSYDLDPRKIALALEDALKLKRIYPRDIARFLKALKPGAHPKK